MAVKERNTWVIYPEYFDGNLSRGECRKVPRKLAVKSPSVDEIADILDSYDLPNRVEKYKHHPATWAQRNGRIIIQKQSGSKNSFLKKVAKALKRERRNH